MSRARAARAREPLGWRRGEGRRAAFGRRAVGDDGAVHGGGGCSAEREEKLAPRRGTLVVAPPRWVTRTQGPVGGEHARDVAGLVASSTRRMRPAQPSTGQVVTSTAKTRRSSHAHGWRDGGSGGAGGATSAGTKSGSCAGGLGDSRPRAGSETRDRGRPRRAGKSERRARRGSAACGSEGAGRGRRAAR